MYCTVLRIFEQCSALLVYFASQIFVITNILESKQAAAFQTATQPSFPHTSTEVFTTIRDLLGVSSTPDIRTIC